MKETRPRLSLALLVISLFLLWGCGKKSERPTTQVRADQQSVASQSDANKTPDANAATTGTANAGTGKVGSAADVKTAGGSAKETPPLVIPAGTPITVRLQEGLSSASAVPGQHFDAVIDQPIVVHDKVVVPAGTPAVGRVVVARRSGRLSHPGVLGLTLDSVTVGKENVRLATSSVVVRGGSHKKRNWGFIGGGTGGGAIIGALAAGGKGALIGSGIGAAAGTTTAFITGKKDVGFGVERRLRFRLDHDVNVSDAGLS